MSPYCKEESWQRCFDPAMLKPALTIYIRPAFRSFYKSPTLFCSQHQEDMVKNRCDHAHLTTWGKGTGGISRELAPQVVADIS